MKKNFVSILSILLIVSMVISTSSAFAMDNAVNIPTLNSHSSNSNLEYFNGEEVLSAYVENNSLYVITRSNREPSAGLGKCPSPSQIVTKTISRKKLIQWRKEKSLEHKVKEYLVIGIVGLLNVGAGFAAQSIAPFLPNIASQCQEILDNSTKKNIKITCEFICTQKVQTGQWFHVWVLNSVKAV